MADGEERTNTVIIAAHNLYYEKNKQQPKESTNIVFFPAMRHAKDEYGRSFATEIGWNIMMWNPNMGNVADNYDFGIVHVGKQYLGESQHTEKDVGNVVRPIPICYDSTKPDTAWMTVGYPARRRDNKEMKMMIQTGVYVPDEVQFIPRIL